MCVCVCHSCLGLLLAHIDWFDDLFYKWMHSVNGGYEDKVGWVSISIFRFWYWFTTFSFIQCWFIGVYFSFSVIMSNILKESDYESHLFMNWFTLVEFGTFWHGKRTKKGQINKKITFFFCCSTQLPWHWKVVRTATENSYRVMDWSGILRTCVRIQMN